MTPVVALDLKWWHAKANLGVRVIIHYLRYLNPWRARYGLARFRQNYVHEGLPHASPAQRDVFCFAGRCTQCGVCDAVCPLLLDDGLRARTAPMFLGPMQFTSSAARAGPLLDDVADTLDAMTGPVCTGCTLCVQKCPERIPILTLAVHLQEQRGVVQASRQKLLKD